MQILESEHHRLSPRPPAKIQAAVAASCRRRNSSGRNSRGGPRAAECRPATRSSGIVFGPVKAGQPQSRGRRSAPRRSHRCRRSAVCPFGERVQGCVSEGTASRPNRPRTGMLQPICFSASDARALSGMPTAHRRRQIVAEPTSIASTLRMRLPAICHSASGIERLAA
jgi:hypothetical protein